MFFMVDFFVFSILYACAPSVLRNDKARRALSLEPNKRIDKVNEKDNTVNSFVGDCIANNSSNETGGDEP